MVKCGGDRVVRRDIEMWSGVKVTRTSRRANSTGAASREGGCGEGGCGEGGRGEGGRGEGGRGEGGRVQV